MLVVVESLMICCAGAGGTMKATLSNTMMRPSMPFPSYFLWPVLLPYLQHLRQALAAPVSPIINLVPANTSKSNAQ